MDSSNANLGGSPTHRSLSSLWQVLTGVASLGGFYWYLRTGAPEALVFLVIMVGLCWYWFFPWIIGRSTGLASVVSYVLVVLALVAGLYLPDSVNPLLPILRNNTPLATADDVLQMNSVSRVFAYTGGEPDVTPIIGRLSIWYDDKRNKSYKLDYVLPDNGGAHSGIAFQFDNPVNLTMYNAIEITIEFSQGANCELKIEDDNTDIPPVYFRLGEGVRPETGMTIVEQENKRQTIRIPIKGNLDKVILTRVNEISLVTSTNFNTGSHYFIVSNMSFVQ